MTERGRRRRERKEDRKPIDWSGLIEKVKGFGEGWKGALTLIVAVATTLWTLLGISADVDHLLGVARGLKGDVKANTRNIDGLNRRLKELDREQDRIEGRVDRTSARVLAIDQTIHDIEAAIQRAIERARRARQ